MSARRNRLTNRVALILTMGVGVFLIWFSSVTQTVRLEYDTLNTQLRDEPIIVASVKISGDSVVIPSWSVFAKGHIWSLVNKQHELPLSFIPNLVDAPVAHTSGQLQVASIIAPKLSSLVSAAAKDDVQLMLSSAYRSASDQQTIYDSYMRTEGRAYVNSYVALPGTSEHQTGLAVDISSYSSACSKAASSCSLDYDAIIWLNDHAAKFGFMQRYPTGKQSITGIAGEAWHYRYVGVELARILTNSGMTLDEFVQQIAPGYAK